MTRMTSPPASRRLGALLLLLPLLGGCAIPGGTTTETTEPGSTPPAASTSGTAETAGAGATPTPPTREQPIATREAGYDTLRLALDLYPVERQEKSVVVNLRIRVLHRPAGEVVSAGHILSAGGASYDSRPDGIRLVDTRAGVAHLPATAEGKPLCAPSFNGGWQTGDQVWATCVFSTPASDEVTVVVPTFGSFTHVPVR